MSESIIRPARPADLDALLAIEGRWGTTPGWTREHFLSELASERSYFVVAERSGAVVGYAGLWKLPPEAQVTTIAVAPESAGRGLGRALLAHLIAVGRSLGCEKLTLEVSAGNVPALALYRAAGFQVVGRRAKLYRDGSDAVLMDLPLGPAPSGA